MDKMTNHALVCHNVLFFFVEIGTKHCERDVPVIGIITLGAFPRTENEIEIFVLARW